LANVKIEYLGEPGHEEKFFDGVNCKMFVVHNLPDRGYKIQLYLHHDPAFEQTNGFVVISKERGVYILDGMLYYVQGAEVLSNDEISLRIRHWVLRRKKELGRIKRELEAFDNLERIGSAQREMIPEAVRLFVWQRDGGKCVKCGSNQKLEFDHIIPVAKGGSNTERNVQLLCEPCNRVKGSQI
jgi:hypothetical protein